MFAYQAITHLYKVKPTISLCKVKPTISYQAKPSHTCIKLSPQSHCVKLSPQSHIKPIILVYRSILLTVYTLKYSIFSEVNLLHKLHTLYCSSYSSRDEPILLFKSPIFFPAIVSKFTYYSKDFAHENFFCS